MGVPEERLRRLGISMEAALQRKPDPSKMAAASDFTSTKISAATAGEFTPTKMAAAESPLSTASQTDSDDSVEVRVRSPGPVQSRKRPRSPSTSDVTSGASDVSSPPPLVVPKKRYRREFEAREEERAAVRGCARHRRRVMFECAACLEAVARRFGWPPEALRPPPTQAPLVPLCLPLPLVYRVPPPPHLLSADPRLLRLTCEAPPPRPSPPPASPDRVPSPPPAEAPLDLTRRPSSGSSSSSATGSSSKRTAFSIENILAGRTAEAGSGCTSASPAPQSVSGPVRAVATKAHGGTSTTSSSLQQSTSTSCSSRRASSSAAGLSCAPPSADRRELANERERQRVRHLTGAFRELSSSVADIAAECTGAPALKFTKVAVLRTAALYIGYLTHVLREGAGVSEQRLYDRMRAAVMEVMTAKSKKGRDGDGEEEEDADV